MHYIHFNLLFLTGISAVQAQYADEYSAFNDPQLADEYIAFNDPQLADEYFAFDDPQLEDLQPTAFEDLQPTAFGHLQPNVFDEEGNVDILQLFDTANTEVDISEDESNPDLFSILPDDQCAASTLAGKNRRRRNASCMSEGDMSGGEELINPAQKLEESLAEPTEHERANYAKGYLTPFALLVCSSGADREMKPLTFTTFTLYNSKRGNQVFFFLFREILYMVS
jgi:hypothetical protein